MLLKLKHYREGVASIDSGHQLESVPVNPESEGVPHLHAILPS